MRDLTREQMVQLAVTRIMNDPKLRFIVVLDHDETGVEIMPSEKGFVWLEGVLAVASKLVDEGVRQRLRVALDPANQEAHGAAVLQMMNRQETKN